jgi:hypothetical protein
VDLRVCFCVLRAVDLDDQSGRHAGKIGYIRTDGHLPAKVTSVDFHMSQMLPEDLLDVRRIRSQAPCRCASEICDGSTSHPNTKL